MVGAMASQSAIVVQRPGLEELIARPYAGGHASAPILLVLATLGTLGAIGSAEFLPSLMMPMILTLVFVLFGAAGLMLFSFVATGDLIEARFDAETQKAHLLYRGPTAHTEWPLPFSKISGARMAMSYGAGGTKVSTPTLDLANGKSLTLPGSTTWADIEAIRDMIGGDTDEWAAAWEKRASAQPHVYARQGRRRG